MDLGENPSASGRTERGAFSPGGSRGGQTAYSSSIGGTSAKSGDARGTRSRRAFIWSAPLAVAGRHAGRRPRTVRRGGLAARLAPRNSGPIRSAFGGKRGRSSSTRERLRRVLETGLPMDGDVHKMLRFLRAGAGSREAAGARLPSRSVGQRARGVTILRDATAAPRPGHAGAHGPGRHAVGRWPSDTRAVASDPGPAEPKTQAAPSPTSRP